MRPEYYADQMRQFSTFLRAKDRVLIASGPLNDDLDFTRALLQNASWTFPHTDLKMQFIDALSIHYYTSPDGEWVAYKEDRGKATGFTEDEWASTLEAALRMDAIIAKNEVLMNERDKENKVGLVIDEWGTWYERDPQGSTLFQQNTLRDALVAAITLNIFHQHTDRVKMAAIAQTVNVLQAMILTEEDRMLLTPTYHVYDMYQVFQGAKPHPLAISNAIYEHGGRKLPAVSASAATGKDGKFYLALANLDPDRTAEITANIHGSAAGRLLTAPAMDSHNTFGSSGVVQPVPFSSVNKRGPLKLLLPAKSVAVVAITPTDEEDS
jgi:alpha-N-arabinofuranosidase